jgi:hypothetical protein
VRPWVVWAAHAGQILVCVALGVYVGRQLGRRLGNLLFGARS